METSPSSGNSGQEDMRAEYNFRELAGVVRGKYAERYKERLRTVRLAKDVADAFQDEDAVNAALREYLLGKGGAKSVG
jgi:uncharacterized protein (DUF4415 family)